MGREQGGHSFSRVASHETRRLSLCEQFINPQRVEGRVLLSITVFLFTSFVEITWFLHRIWQQLRAVTFLAFYRFGVPTQI